MCSSGTGAGVTAGAGAAAGAAIVVAAVAELVLGAVVEVSGGAGLWGQPVDAPQPRANQTESNEIAETRTFMGARHNVSCEL